MARQWLRQAILPSKHERRTYEENGTQSAHDLFCRHKSKSISRSLFFRVLLCTFGAHSIRNASLSFASRCCNHNQLFISQHHKDIMWTVECLPDPVSDVALTSSKGSSSTHSSIVLGRLPISQLLTDTSQQEAFQQGQRVARVALADLVARQVAHYSSATRTNHSNNNGNTATSTTVSSSQQQDGHCHQVTVEPLDKYLTSKSRRAKSRKPTNGNSYVPYILERSDVWCNETHLHVVVRVIVSSSPQTETNDPDDASYIMTDEKKTDTTNTIVMDEIIKNAATSFLSNCIIVNESISSSQHQQIIMQHVACAVVQNRLREKLKLDGNVAFVADGSILPRKSGASTLPMASPPAIPFEAPKDSPTRQSLTVEMGLLAKYLPQYDDTSSVTFTGLVVPAGITLICGGGYHGKVRSNQIHWIVATF